MYIIEYPEPADPIPVYVSIRGGYLHAMVRATDKTTFEQQAVAVGLVVPDDNMSIRRPDGSLRTPVGIDVCEIGPLTLTPGTYDGEGNELTPPVVDQRYHANFVLSAERTADGAWEQWAVAWSAYGQPGTPNRAEESLVYSGIELIDPDTVASPSNVIG